MTSIGAFVGLSVPISWVSRRSLLHPMSLGLSIVFAVWGLVCLRRFGGFRPMVEASPTFGWENTGQLVTTGIYHYIRHPMYSSLLFLAWGALLKSVDIYALLLCVAASLALVATAKTEEAENIRRFGDEYRDYMKVTRRFVPFLL